MMPSTHNLHLHRTWPQTLTRWALAVVWVGGVVLWWSAPAWAQEATQQVGEAVSAATSSQATERMLEVFTVLALCVVLLLLKWSDRGRIEPPPPVHGLLEWAPDEDGQEFTLGQFSANLEGVEMVHSGEHRLPEAVATPLPDTDQERLSGQAC
ncbi:MAG: hypothetical protein AAFX99_06175 [Myxococcota bacterium]